MGAAPETVNVHEAKTNLSRMLREVEEKGAEFILARNGKPIARLTPLRTTRRLGLYAGQIEVGEDFDAPLPDDLQDAFSSAE